MAVRAINGDIVFTPTGLQLVKKRQKTSKRRAQRLKVKSVVEHNVLSR